MHRVDYDLFWSFYQLKLINVAYDVLRCRNMTPIVQAVVHGNYTAVADVGLAILQPPYELPIAAAIPKLLVNRTRIIVVITRGHAFEEDLVLIDGQFSEFRICFNRIAIALFGFSLSPRPCSGNPQLETAIFCRRKHMFIPTSSKRFLQKRLCRNRDLSLPDEESKSAMVKRGEVASPSKLQRIAGRPPVLAAWPQCSMPCAIDFLHFQQIIGATKRKAYPYMGIIAGKSYPFKCCRSHSTLL